MQDAWKAYVELALGLTDASRKKATKVAKGLVGKGNATATQVQALAEDLISTGMANRDSLTRLVRYELDRALGVVGLATAEEVADLTARVKDLERQLQEAREAAAVPSPLAAADDGAPAADNGAAAPVRRTVARKTVAKKAVAKKAAPAAAPAKAAAPVKKAVAKKTVAKKTVARKAAPAKKGMRA